MLLLSFKKKPFTIIEDDDEEVDFRPVTAATTISSRRKPVLIVEVEKWRRHVAEKNKAWKIGQGPINELF